MLEEAGKFAADVIAPLNAVGDKFGTPFKDGAVTTPPGWKEAYTLGGGRLERRRRAGGLRRSGPAARGQRRLHRNVEFGLHGVRLGPVLTMAAVEALDAYGSDALKQLYLEKLATGEWIGTMQLTEPQAGSDVGALRTARRAPTTAATASPARRSSSPMASTISPTTSSISCSPACPTRPRHQGHFAVPDSEVPAGRHAQRRARAFGRTQARHPCLADLHHGLWR